MTGPDSSGAREPRLDAGTCVRAGPGVWQAPQQPTREGSQMSTITTNRVQAAIDRIAERCADLAPDAAADLEREMDVTAAEHFAYQEAQARAHVSGRLSAGEAMIVYRALGETGSRGNGGWAAGTDLPTKVAATLLMGELIGGRR